MQSAEAVFIVNLLQDVNILRPLVFLARDVRMSPRLVLMSAFDGRDTSGAWRMEIEEIARESAATVQRFSHPTDVVRSLRGSGVVFAGSESNLNAHRASRDILHGTPQSYVTVTLQHGFECVGFLQSRNHDRAHGEEVVFAADVVCGWSVASCLTSLAVSQRDKLLVTGPTALLQRPKPGPKSGRGIVCENLHSVRFSSGGDFKADFVTVFHDFCAAQSRRGASVVLRPHPGGQYVLRHNVPLPANVVLNNHPIYKVDLSKYTYGISAPSSIIIDMILAGIPTAVWSNQGGEVDAGNYQGLAHVSSLDEWLAFAREAEADPTPFRSRQEAFLRAKQLQCDPLVTHRTFSDLMLGAVRMAERRGAEGGVALRRCQRVMFVANGMLPTLLICFASPLSPDVANGAMQLAFLTEETMRQALPSSPDSADAESSAVSQLAAFAPDLVVFCRYSGPHARSLMEWSRTHAVPTIFHIDDDLLAVPRELGDGKYRHHNSPQRTEAIRFLVGHADMLYCVNPTLHERLKPIRGDRPSYVGRIAGPGRVLRSPPQGRCSRIGYMGMSHAHDLEPLVPVIGELLRRRPDVDFHLYGNTPKPQAWNGLGSRIVMTPPSADYDTFRKTFAALEWGIGIAPLLNIPFNRGKTNLKWVDYTSVGVAVIASRGTLYDECCADGCGLLADSPEEWLAAMEFLLDHPEERVAQVLRAQRRMEEAYSSEALRQQVLEVFARAHDTLESRTANPA